MLVFIKYVLRALHRSDLKSAGIDYTLRTYICKDISTNKQHLSGDWMREDLQKKHSFGINVHQESTNIRYAAAAQRTHSFKQTGNGGTRGAAQNMKGAVCAD
jgi:hypothetical protein